MGGVFTKSVPSKSNNEITEKETRINNPHKLESKTTMKDVYKGERGEH
jgi:hypothetical protein